MTQDPSRSIRLFGTEEPVTPPRLLSAGPLSAELEAGNLRYVRWHGVEVMRAISFCCRYHAPASSSSACCFTSA